MDYLGTKEGQVVIIKDVVGITASNSVTYQLVSKDVCYFGDDAGNELKENMERAQRVGVIPNLADIYPVFSRFDLQGLKKKSLKITKLILATWQDIIEERRRSTHHAQERQDFLDILLANGFADDQICYFITELVTAGTDTVTLTVEWAMAELMKNKEAMEKACEELASEINQDIIMESDLSKLPYLLACVMETLRLYPAGILIPHRATETCQVMNYTIPKDATVLVNLWAIGRDLVVWEDPLSFKPERFLHSKVNFQGQNYEYLPFSSGRRMCPGYLLATTKQVLLFLANLLHRFDWHLPDDGDPKGLDMSGKYSMTFHKEIPLCLVPRRRH